MMHSRRYIAFLADYRIRFREVKGLGAWFNVLDKWRAIVSTLISTLYDED